MNSLYETLANIKICEMIENFISVDYNIRLNQILIYLNQEDWDQMQQTF